MISDLSYLKTLSGEDESFIRDMINIFKEQFAEYADEMPALVKKADYINLSKLAHKAKSSVAVMGMSKVADQLQKLELLAKIGEQKETYEGIIQDFLTQTSLAIKELEEAYP